MTVSELTIQIRNTLEPKFEQVEVEGEISNVHYANSGHVYFTLKDAGAMIQAVSFNHARVQHVVLAEGMQIKVLGRVTIYMKRGNYQIICARVEEVGSGAILAMLEARKRRLADAGLFDAGRKVPIPKFVRSIALITSPRGAAIRDFLEVTRRRNNTIDIVVVPCAVQGEEAAAQICARIEYINAQSVAEIIVMTRGGGSLEDLLPFSDESVVHAVSRSTIPIVAAIGHEVDTALCELAADMRASTPSVAAELVSVEKKKIAEQVQHASAVMDGAMAEKVKYMQTALAHYSPARLQQLVMRAINMMKIHLDGHAYKLQSGVQDLLLRKKHALKKSDSQLRALSPTAILKRGFAIVTDKKNGAVVTSSAGRHVGEGLSVRLGEGSVEADITAITQ